MEDQKSLFQYSFVQKNGTLVVSLSGEMSPFILPSLEACRQEMLLKDDFRQVVFLFQGVPEISSAAIPWIAQIQREVRLRKAELRLVNLQGGIRDRLIKMGVVRGMEVSEDLKSALLSFARAAA